MKNIIKLGLIQMKVTKDKSVNIKKAVELIKDAYQKGSELIVLPECWNSPYGTEYFKDYAENEDDSLSLKSISEISKELGVFVIAGSIPTKEDSKYFNSCFVFDSKGNKIAKYQKIHLFDIDIPNKITFQESKILSPGSKLTIFEFKGYKIGLGICFDIRFMELSNLYQKKGCDILVYPGAFNMTTGPNHWELLARSRALDNQLYVVVCSPSRDENASYVAFGHSMVCNPYGKVVESLDEKENILITELEMDYINLIRQQIPVINNKRNDLYFIEEKQ